MEFAFIMLFLCSFTIKRKLSLVPDKQTHFNEIIMSNGYVAAIITSRAYYYKNISLEDAFWTRDSAPFDMVTWPMVALYVALRSDNPYDSLLWLCGIY